MMVQNHAHVSTDLTRENNLSSLLDFLCWIPHPFLTIGFTNPHVPKCKMTSFFGGGNKTHAGTIHLWYISLHLDGWYIAGWVSYMLWVWRLQEFVELALCLVSRAPPRPANLFSMEVPLWPKRWWSHGAKSYREAVPIGKYDFTIFAHVWIHHFGVIRFLFLGGIKQRKCMAIIWEFPSNSALLGLVM